MAVKTIGAEFKAFYADESLWPKDSWHDDASLSVDGVEQPDGIDVDNLSDTAVVTIEGGFVKGIDDDEPSLETFFKRWRKQQNTTIFTVSCDKSIVDAVKAAIRAAGGKVS